MLCRVALETQKVEQRINSEVAQALSVALFKGELKPKFNTFLHCSFKKSNTYKIKLRWLFVSVALLFFDNLV